MGVEANRRAEVEQREWRRTEEAKAIRETMDETVKAIAKLAVQEALLAVLDTVPCPTCGGLSVVEHVVDGVTMGDGPCLDCKTGRIKRELAAVLEACEFLSGKGVGTEDVKAWARERWG